MIPTDRGFRHAPNSEVVVVHPATPDTPTLYKTNSLGYRNPEIGPKRGERILFLGDSITLGLALNEADTFPGWWRTSPGGMASAGKPSTPA